MPVARHVRIRGRVQGVFFRAWTREEAQKLGVTGWVRNCSDGSVEARLEGEPDCVSTLIGRMRSGPPEARVDLVDVDETEVEDLTEFRVRH